MLEGHAEELVERTRELLEGGDNLAAADASAAARNGPPDGRAAAHLAHLHVVALARSGATAAARRALAELDLEAASARLDDARLAEDVAALGARLHKDDALTHRTPASLRRAAAAYEQVWRTHGSAYGAVNAATLRSLAGDTEDAHRLARAALATATGPDHWAALSAAEARFVLRDLDGVADDLRRAVDRDAPTSARVVARRQLRLLATAHGVDDGWESLLPVPGVAHGCGHLLAGDDEGALRAEVDRVLERHDVGVLVTSLAAGGDITIAEAAIARGAAVHVVLPFDWDDLVRLSVRPAGEHWVGRADACRAAATSERTTTDGGHLDDAQFALASHVAMGLALLHGDALTVDPVQVAVWDGTPAAGDAGTGADVATWRATGRATEVVAPLGTRVRAAAPPASGLPPRVVRAVLFGDVHGFSALPDAAVPPFFAEVMGSLAAVLDEAGDAVEYRNGWGDGLYLVCSDVDAAVDLAAALHAAMARDWSSALPRDLELRLGGHAGLVFDGHDPIRDEPTFFGGTATRAARIEPRTPPGATYVTDEFAALWRLSSRSRGHRAEYVGRVPLHKGAGSLPMRRLEPLSTG